jgi:hypothetical protein
MGSRLQWFAMATRVRKRPRGPGVNGGRVVERV